MMRKDFSILKPFESRINKVFVISKVFKVCFGIIVIKNKG